ncbi:hypothetical protein C3D80_21510 [Cronobacter sakazakii]|uniref:Uncharacterized protein n=1 Tax=Cronobacter sakazakii (strain ATCC BAA-894) TaxID=290339 RepID=A7MHZ6_CROS8|nr:hypothetical protein [Cronobacter sakazakii]ABU75907.1 hypothetical protein ESA_00623 [Cronobacter sakazakii ATCC BAA-894]EJQ1335141.1 hypothetical protein [Cronobacter sakazakii]EJQ1504195.1 hypothetical protein [Cronobacter sakazakii]EJQ1512862.1 hypothetical protein [Cronobacter sakazakii]EJQ1519440.1 hypothetical protein [Cronobacter sakazakii]
MNTLAERHNGQSACSISHADYLRLLHAHSVGVTVLDMFDSVNCLSAPGCVPDGAALASVVALLTDQLGKVVETCQSRMFATEARHDDH